MTTLLDKFSFDKDLFSSVAETPEIFETTSGTTLLRRGKRVPYTASINGVTVPAYVTLREANLTRISLLTQQMRSQNNREYYLVTGIMNPVKLDIELSIDGELVSITNLLHKVAQEATGKEISYEDFILTARRIGLNFEDGMPLFFQQFGANYDGFQKIANMMRNHGATDATKGMANQGRIQEAWSFPRDTPGIPVSAFELGTVDRTKSARFRHDGVGQGFLNLVDAQIEQFTRIVGLRKEAAKQKELQANGANDLSQAEIKKIAHKIETATSMSRQWASNWAGAQKRLVQLKNGSFEEQDMYDPVNAPCGRFTVVSNGSTVDVDLWTSRKVADTSAQTSTSTVNVDSDDNNDLPF